MKIHSAGITTVSYQGGFTTRYGVWIKKHFFSKKKHIVIAEDGQYELFSWAEARHDNYIKALVDLSWVVRDFPLRNFYII